MLSMSLIVFLSNKQKWLIRSATVFFLAFSTAFIASSILAPQSTTNADTLSFEVTGSDYSTSVSATSSIEMDIEATPQGTLAVAHDTVTTITNNPDGYKLYFSMDQASDYDSTHPGNALYQGGLTTGDSLAPTSGTIASPTALANNTWGFALLGGANIQSGVPSTFSNFDATYVDSDGNSSDGSTGASLIASNKFAAVPLKPAAVVVQESNSATSLDGDTLDVYYGAKADLVVGSGTYSGTVDYFIVSDASVSSIDAISLFPSELSPDGGENMTIVTSLHSNYPFTDSDITVTLTDKSDSTNTGTCTISDITADTGNVTITCETPALAAGDYEVEVEIPMYAKTWTSDVEVVGPNFWNITYMQDMTTDICDALYTPSNATSSSVTMITDEATYKATVSGDNQPYVAQRTLYDYRGLDGTGTKDAPATGSNMAGYTVSKLADGNCWMTSNLKLGLSTSQAIEVVTNSTGVAKSTKWTPTGSGGTSNAATPMNGNTVCTGSGDSRNCWYSWYAATAGSGTSGQTNTDASDSICPAGWRLPSNYTTSTTKSYSALTNAYFNITSNTSTGYYTQLEANPMLFTRAGGYVSGSLYASGSYGFYWSATAYSSSSYAYYFSYDTSYTYPQVNDYKYLGFSVRCLAV